MQSIRRGEITLLRTKVDITTKLKVVLDFFLKQTTAMYSESQEPLSTWSITSSLPSSSRQGEPIRPVAGCDVISPPCYPPDSSEPTPASRNTNDFYVDVDNDADDELKASSSTPRARSCRIAGLVQSNKMFQWQNYLLQRESDQRRRHNEEITIYVFFLCGICLTLVVLLGWTVFVLRA
jgi:hypothetical protein